MRKTAFRLAICGLLRCKMPQIAFCHMFPYFTVLPFFLFTFPPLVLTFYFFTLLPFPPFVLPFYFFTLLPFPPFVLLFYFFSFLPFLHSFYRFTLYPFTFPHSFYRFTFLPFYLSFITSSPACMSRQAGCPCHTHKRLSAQAVRGFPVRRRRAAASPPAARRARWGIRPRPGAAPRP